MRAGFVVIAALVAGSAGLSRSRLTPAEQASCTAPEYRQFDFWVGDWDAFDASDSRRPVARTRVERILGGCVLLENYRGANGSHGESFSIYDQTRKVWHQSWVTNRGKLLVIEGGMEDGGMTLSGVEREANGKERRVRGTWKRMGEGVRETAVASVDGGKTWDLWFDLMFRPHRD